eukprot:5021950-Pyramimonas_sp.AAC.1
MRQADATDVSKSIPVITSTAPLQLELSAENGQHLSRSHKEYEWFCGLSSGSTPILSSGFGRRTRLMSPNRFL